VHYLVDRSLVPVEGEDDRLVRGEEFDELGQYYSFYEISDKGTAWLGPAAFALVFQLTHSYRLGVVSLIVFFVAGFLLLLAVPIRCAIVAAGNTPPRVLYLIICYLSINVIDNH
jgi:hypothetical protein